MVLQVTNGLASTPVLLNQHALTERITVFQSEVLTAEDKLQFVKPTLDDLLAQRLPSGNFPSSQGSRNDRLVQWCHGAPGFAELLATAYKVSYS